MTRRTAYGCVLVASWTAYEPLTGKAEPVRRLVTVLDENEECWIVAKGDHDTEKLSKACWAREAA